MTDTTKWKVGNEFAPYHPSASHVDPSYRDGWNACYKAAATPAATDERELFEAAFLQRHPEWSLTRWKKGPRAGDYTMVEVRFAWSMWQAARAQLAAPRAVPRKVYLVATGEIVGGEETYTRHDDAPPPLCDSELLYTSAPASQAGRDALDAEGDLLALQRFASAVMEDWNTFGDLDGLDRQNIAESCGLLEQRTVTAPCGDSCGCAEAGTLFPTDCYFETAVMHRASRAAALAGTPGAPMEQRHDI